MILSFGRQMLSRLGYRVSTHTAGADALASFRAAPHDYDLVITDQSMPRMTGLELIEELRHLRPDLPVILTSGFARKATSTTEAHVTAFLSKPFSKQIMAETVARALGRIQG